MRWEDLADNVWTIPAAEREKGTGEVLELPPLAMEVLGERGSGLVFPTPRGFAFSNGRDKGKLDEASGVTGWRFHDLRRTARSLMSRAGVRPDIGERVLGHAIGGVAGVYDRHSYTEAKADALAKLAGLIGLILAPKDNVVHIKRTAG
jgi:integrase